MLTPLRCGVFAAMASLLVACAPRAYVPTQPWPSSGDDSMAAHTEKLEVGKVFYVTTAIDRAPAGARLIEVDVTADTSAPCSRSWAVYSLAVDGETAGAYGATLKEGARVRVGIAGVPELAQRPMRVDLVVEDSSGRRCLPVPFTSNEPERAWSPSNQGFWGFHVDAAGYTAQTSGSVATVAAGMRFGRWFGPSRLYGGLGIGSDACSGARCAPVSGGGPAGGLALPVEIGLDTLGIPLGQSAFFGDAHLGIGVRYQVTPTFLPTYAGGQWHGYDGVFVVPSFSFGLRDPLAPGVPGGMRAAGAEVQIPIGLIAPMPEHNHLAVSIGVGLSFGATTF